MSDADKIRSRRYDMTIRGADGSLNADKLSLVAIGIANRAILNSKVQSPSEDGKDSPEDDISQMLSDYIKKHTYQHLIELEPSLDSKDVKDHLNKLARDINEAEIKVRENGLCEGLLTFENIYIATIYELVLSNVRFFDVTNVQPSQMHEYDELESDVRIDVRVGVGDETWSFEDVSRTTYKRRIDGVLIVETNEMGAAAYESLGLTLVYEQLKIRLKHRVAIAKSNPKLKELAHSISLIIPVPERESLLYAVDFSLFKSQFKGEKSKGAQMIADSIKTEVGCTQNQAEQIGKLFFLINNFEQKERSEQ